MSDEGHSVGDECGVAEYVIRMHVRVDDVTHRQARALRDGGAKAFSHYDAAAGVDYGDTARAHDEADIGLIAHVCGRAFLDSALVHEYTRRNLGEVESGVGIGSGHRRVQDDSGKRA